MGVFFYKAFPFFFFNDTATTEIYTLSLHDALPILKGRRFERLVICNDLVDEAVVKVVGLDARLLRVGRTAVRGKQPVGPVRAVLGAYLSASLFDLVTRPREAEIG